MAVLTIFLENCWYLLGMVRQYPGTLIPSHKHIIGRANFALFASRPSPLASLSPHCNPLGPLIWVKPCMAS